MIKHTSNSIHKMPQTIFDSLYQWTFPVVPENTSDFGFKDSMSENFKGHPYASLVREAIQNSLDVPLNPDKPVEVAIEIKSLNLSSFPHLMSIKDHIWACFQNFKSYEGANITYNSMLDYIRSLDKNNELPYIKISDYNTTGMKYEPHNNTNAFYAFVRAGGVSFKSNNAAGGSYGFGKAAYFDLSPIRTMLVSTVTKDGEEFFEGVSSLCTHRNQKGNKLAHIGYFDCNKGYPVVEPDKIIRRFKRIPRNGDSLEPGTDFNILGLDPTGKKTKSEIYQEMIEAVLRNFWLSINDKKLIVRVGDVSVNDENLENVMKKYFLETNDNGNVSTYNPRPYLETIMSAGADKRHCLYQLNLDEDEYYRHALPNLKEKMGTLKFYASRSKNGSNKVLYMRAPKMLVSRKTNSAASGFYGVFLCDNGFANSLLREVENPAHNEWELKHLDKASPNRDVIKYMMKSINDFIVKSLQKLMGTADAEFLDIPDLNQYFYIPTDVEDDDDDAPEAFVGNPTGGIKDDGTSMTTTIDPNDPKPANAITPGKVITPNPITASPDPKGDNYGGKGNHPIKRPGGGMGTQPKDRYKNDPSGKAGSYLVSVPVKYRTFATSESGKTVHHLIIHSDVVVKHAQVFVMVGGDEKTDKIDIISSTAGTVKDNAIIDLPLQTGVNKIDIKFADGIKHSIKLEVYED